MFLTTKKARPQRDEHARGSTQIRSAGICWPQNPLMSGNGNARRFLVSARPAHGCPISESRLQGGMRRPSPKGLSARGPSLCRHASVARVLVIAFVLDISLARNQPTKKAPRPQRDERARGSTQIQSTSSLPAHSLLFCNGNTRQTLHIRERGLASEISSLQLQGGKRSSWPEGLSAGSPLSGRYVQSFMSLMLALNLLI